AADRVGDLATQYLAPLLLRVTRFRESGASDQLLEAEPVELFRGSLKIGIRGDLAGYLAVGDIEAQLSGLLVERRLGQHLPEQLLLKAQCAGLIRGDGTTDAPAELLDPVVVGLPEWLHPDLGRSDLGEKAAPETAKDVTDAPYPEADDQ